MINSKKVIKRLESNPEVNFSNDKSLMPIANTIRDWLDQTESESKTIERILIHQTLNDYEKAAGLFFLGCLVTGHVLASIQSIDDLEGFIKQKMELTSEKNKK